MRKNFQQFRSHRPTGFTLLELMVSLTVASIIAAIATSAVATLLKQGNRTEQSAKADAEAKIIVDALTSKYQQAAGGAFRPQDVMVVEQNCAAMAIGSVALPACDNTDRVHHASFTGTQRAMNVTSSSVIEITAEDSSGNCIFDGDSARYLDQLVVVLEDPQSVATGATQFMTRVVTGADDSSCELTLSGTASGFESDADLTNYNSGYVVLGHVESTYVDSSDNILKMVRPNATGVPTLYKLTPGTYDFQLRFGFDLDGDQLVETFSGSVASSSSATALRSVQVGVIMGTTSSSFEAGKTAQIMDGPTRTATSGLHLREAVSTVGFRNIYLFY